MSLLTPHDRSLLLESLRPPQHYELDSAIATTFSLDLLALMVAPVGFTFFEFGTDESTPDGNDPMVLLEAIRRHSSQILIFCQAGQIAVPAKHRLLFSYLEDRIVQVQAPTPKHAFHPKVWVLRYVPTTPGGPVRYRLLCSSRNLTFDASWDTLLLLDGELREDREKGYAVNAPLREFLESLPGMAARPLPQTHKVQLKRIYGEISRVDWSLSDTPFEQLTAFWPLGHDGAKHWPFRNSPATRLLIMSPFVTQGALDRLAKEIPQAILISRGESLDAISSETLGKYDEVYTLDAEPATLEQSVETEDETALSTTESMLRGLHAKFYLADEGWDSTIWTGSANATSAAFGGNVEFLVELQGKKSQIGIDALFEQVKGSSNFRDMLQPYVAPDSPTKNAELEALQQQVDQLRSPLAIAGWSITLEGGQQTDEYVAVARSSSTLPSWGDQTTVSCRLLSMDPTQSRPLTSATHAEVNLGTLSTEALTSFLVLHVKSTISAGSCIAEFVVNAELVGAPSNRRERLLQTMLRDRRSLVRFLLLLLAEITDDTTFEGAGVGGAWTGRSQTSVPEESLLEPLLRALDRRPERLKAIQSILVELRSSPEGQLLIPDGFNELFDAVWSASQAVPS